MTPGAGKTDARQGGKPPTPEQAAEQLQPSTPVFIQFMEAPADLTFYEGIVEKIEDTTLTIQFIGQTPPDNIENLNIHYPNDKNQFVSISGEIEEDLHTEPNATYVIRLCSMPRAADRRAAFRVSVVNLQMIAEVGKYPTCQILDMSFDTIGVITPEELEVDRTVQVQFFYRGEQVLGQMRVRTCIDRGNATYRCGLQAYGKAAQLRQMLQSVTMDVQLNQLKRLAEVSSTHKKGGTINQKKAAFNQLQLHMVMNASLIVGKPLPGELRDVEGNLCAEAGAILTEDQVKAIASKPFKLTHAWISKPSPKVLEKTKVKGKDGKNYAELRQHQRLDWEIKSSVQVCSDSDKRKLEVMTCDVSASGFSFKANTYIHVGSPVELTVEIDGQMVKLSGIVMNCRLISAPYHRVGVQLTKREILKEKAAG